MWLCAHVIQYLGQDDERKEKSLQLTQYVDIRCVKAPLSAETDPCSHLQSHNNGNDTQIKITVTNKAGNQTSICSGKDMNSSNQKCWYQHGLSGIVSTIVPTKFNPCPALVMDYNKSL